MEKKSLKYYGAFLLIVVSAVAYLISSQQQVSEPKTQPALVTQPVTEGVIEETASPTTTAAAQPSFDAFKDLEKESDTINSLESLLN